MACEPGAVEPCDRRLALAVSHLRPLWGGIEETAAGCRRRSHSLSTSSALAGDHDAKGGCGRLGRILRGWRRPFLSPRLLGLFASIRFTGPVRLVEVLRRPPSPGDAIEQCRGEAGVALHHQPLHLLLPRGQSVEDFGGDEVLGRDGVDEPAGARASCARGGCAAGHVGELQVVRFARVVHTHGDARYDDRCGEGAHRPIGAVEHFQRSLQHAQIHLLPVGHGEDAAKRRSQRPPPRPMPVEPTMGDQRTEHLDPGRVAEEHGGTGIPQLRNEGILGLVVQHDDASTPKKRPRAAPHRIGDPFGGLVEQGSHQMLRLRIEPDHQIDVARPAHQLAR